MPRRRLVGCTASVMMCASSKINLTPMWPQTAPSSSSTRYSPNGLESSSRHTILLHGLGEALPVDIHYRRDVGDAHRTHERLRVCQLLLQGLRSLRTSASGSRT